MPPLSVQTEAQAVAAKAKALGLRQEQIAHDLGVNQSQISRIFRGHISRRSSLFISLCIYVSNYGQQVSIDSIRLNEELLQALADTWDGTPQHSTALAAVIRSLGALKPTREKSPSVKGEAAC